jgi:hypothetical protein
MQDHKLYILPAHNNVLNKVSLILSVGQMSRKSKESMDLLHQFGFCKFCDLTVIHVTQFRLTLTVTHKTGPSHFQSVIGTAISDKSFHDLHFSNKTVPVAVSLVNISCDNAANLCGFLSHAISSQKSY